MESKRATVPLTAVLPSDDSGPDRSLNRPLLGYRGVT